MFIQKRRAYMYFSVQLITICAVVKIEMCVVECAVVVLSTGGVGYTKFCADENHA